VRAAAKNYESVAVVVQPQHYATVLDDLKKHGEVSLATRRMLAERAFELTARYDAAIAQYFKSQRAQHEKIPPDITLNLQRSLNLRYGENPHQDAGLYVAQGDRPAFEQIHGKEISYNNILDLFAAWELACEFKRPTCAIVKHTNPCGCASADALAEAYRLACDSERPPWPTSRYGGIIGFNRPLDAATAGAVAGPGSFYEVIAAPDFAEGVKEIFTVRKGWGQNVRLVRMRRDASRPWALRSAGDGFLLETPDRKTIDGDALDLVAGAKPDGRIREDLLFAFAVVKHVKSNAIVVARDGQVIGVGAGQMNRVTAVRLALEQAGDRAAGAVLASDGFFPFPDSVEMAAQRGIAAVIQPGGSVKDAEVIARARELKVTMMLTGIRHFKH